MKDSGAGHDLVVGTFTPSVLLRVADEGGYLARARLRVQEVPVASSPQQFRSLLDRELDAVLTSPDNVLAYRFSPTNPLRTLADVRIVSTVDRGLGLSLWLRAPRHGERWAGAEMLRGARIGVDVATSGFALAMYALIESLGVARHEYELIALGSTPNRRKALIAGDCDATMLNAGNELLAHEAGCLPLAGIAPTCTPYVGTVLGVAGDAQLPQAQALARALRAAARDIVGGEHDELAAGSAQSLLGLSPTAARRFVTTLKDRENGLILADEVDKEGLGTVAALRRRFLPEPTDGGDSDVLDNALDPTSGLVVA